MFLDSYNTRPFEIFYEKNKNSVKRGRDMHSPKLVAILTLKKKHPAVNYTMHHNLCSPRGQSELPHWQFKLRLISYFSPACKHRGAHTHTRTHRSKCPHAHTHAHTLRDHSMILTHRLWLSKQFELV